VFSLCQALHVDSLDQILHIDADAINNVIHNVTHIHPNGIVANVSKKGFYHEILLFHSV